MRQWLHKARIWIEELPKHWIFIALTVLATVITILMAFPSLLRGPNEHEVRQLSEASRDGALGDPSGWLVRSARVEHNLDKRLAQVRAALDLNPDNGEARLLLAITLARKLEWEQAESQLKEYVRRFPDKEWVAQAVLAQEQTQTEDTRAASLETAAHAMELHPSTAGPFLVYGLALYANGMYQRAVVQLDKAGVLPGDEILDTRNAHAYAQALKGLALWASDKTRQAEAIELIEQALGRFTEPMHKSGFSVRLGAIYREGGATEKAAECFNEALKNPETRSADRASALFHLGHMAILREEYSDALSLLERSRTECSDLPNLSVNLGYVHQRLGKVDKAVDFYTDEVLRGLSSEAVEYALGCLEAMGRRADAIQTCREALGSPKTAAMRHFIQLQLGWLLIRNFQPGEAKAAGLELVKTNPNDRESWSILGSSYVNLQEYDAASGAYRKAITLADTDRERSIETANLAQVQLLLGNHAEAAVLAKEATNYDTHCARAHFVNGSVILLSEGPDAAYEYLEPRLALCEKDPCALFRADARCAVAAAATKLGQFDKAYDLLGAAVRECPSHEWANLMYALVCMRKVLAASPEEAERLLSDAEKHASAVGGGSISPEFRMIREMNHALLAMKDEQWIRASAHVAAAKAAFAEADGRLPESASSQWSELRLNIWNSLLLVEEIIKEEEPKRLEELRTKP
ncbi:MAG: tetratricopeptide repeat protein [Planctomycetes bacterium]|nr:tetratricopeptide repeat protein [Planctomycetota bacterium]